MRLKVNPMTSAKARGRARARALLLAGILVGAPAVAPGAEGDGEPMKLKGEIVDLACYVPRGDKGRGPGHEECAEMCAKGGAPLGILGDDGNVILLVEDHAKPSPYGQVKKLAGKQAEVEGKKFTRGGVAVLVVSSATGL
jgi:hypothetical protein